METQNETGRLMQLVHLLGRCEGTFKSIQFLVPKGDYVQRLTQEMIDEIDAAFRSKEVEVDELR